MIVGTLKPFEEIVSSITGYKKILVIGCGSCVTVCLSGGDREAHALTQDLYNKPQYKDGPPSFHVETFQRQCELDLVKTYLEVPESTDAILSLACGAGVQTLAEAFPDLPVIPAINTTFLGALDEPGTWREKCRGCGDCILTYTAGICPVARCAKRVFNGPCGGSSGGKCEVSEDVDCAWQVIIDRLKALGRLDDYEKLFTFKDWSAHGAGGPRKARRATNYPLD
ncbi:MAG: methylenetetrahydrofolate reductase C-terminal domain-containing protein [Deltaproteobacteria bacterium]|nr:methylenetetrahydrofolate reductase C-terminal domain-containing protein [Deltaproteobacteria bacterium]MBW2137034.1 methylenetetrahydrofolate reductase C-terminal domain-containing protein [Deltaproteobacteria bacterium]